MIHIDFRAPTPIYEQVRDGFRTLILSGVLTEGEKMPSVRELAASLAINPNTIQRAYRELEAEGYTATVPGRGSFVCAIAETSLARRQELKGRFTELVQKLKTLGTDEETLIEWIRGGEEK